MASYLPHYRDARTKGIPSLGAGAIYPVAETEIVCKPFKIPDYFPRCFALDVGWNRTACLWGARDPATDVVYLYAEHYRGQAEPILHVEAIKARGEWIPGVIDPSARGRKLDDGVSMMDLYSEYGLRKLTPAVNAVDTGLDAVWQRLSTGRLKIFESLRNWRAEYRLYRRDEKGKIVKKNDHLMDCTRYLVVSGINVMSVKPAPARSIPSGTVPSSKAGY